MRYRNYYNVRNNPVNSIPIKTMNPLSDLWDIDSDGVPDKYDCKPLDRRYQGKFHISRKYVKSSRYPEAKKTGAFKSEQIREYKLKIKNSISRKMYNRSYMGLTTKEKNRVDAVFTMYEREGVLIK